MSDILLLTNIIIDIFALWLAYDRMKKVKRIKELELREKTRTEAAKEKHLEEIKIVQVPGKVIVHESVVRVPYEYIRDDKEKAMQYVHKAMAEQISNNIIKDKIYVMTEEFDLPRDEMVYRAKIRIVKE